MQIIECNVVFSLPPPPQFVGPLAVKPLKGAEKLLAGKIHGAESIVVEKSESAQFLPIFQKIPTITICMCSEWNLFDNFSIHNFHTISFDRARVESVCEEMIYQF